MIFREAEHKDIYQGQYVYLMKEDNVWEGFSDPREIRTKSHAGFIRSSMRNGNTYFIWDDQTDLKDMQRRVSNNAHFMAENQYLRRSRRGIKSHFCRLKRKIENLSEELKLLTDGVK